jgi:hypothetical protein
MATKTESIQLKKNSKECFGHFMECSLCSNYQVCFDKNPKDVEETIKNCVVCEQCENNRQCLLKTMSELMKNKIYRKIALQSLLNRVPVIGIVTTRRCPKTDPITGSRCLLPFGHTGSHITYIPKEEQNNET